ncbi:MAG: RsmB/NOP family class I SAM-dependent RNA methyltransferase [Bacteroidetes bacterium]|nr:RsmB/NOP family class I SAM-dependent RNA methyltransferase [Bacteroidota bacterium]
MREENQLKLITRIIEDYRFDHPFSRYLKDFFKTHPQMGSRDRRQASSFSYHFFRMGKALSDLRMAERLTIANFLCAEIPNPLLSYCIEKYSLLKEEDLAGTTEHKIEKIREHYPYFNPGNIFPFKEHLGGLIDREQFVLSMLRQPKLWIRIRKKYLESVFNELNQLNISFHQDEKNPFCVSLENATSLEQTESYRNGYFEIQDWSSQQIIHFIEPGRDETWWDACAGSGGKSLMIADAEPSVKIIASDNRTSILKNFEERFRKAGLKNYKTMLMDLANAPLLSEADHGRISILADVPCTGSGTWARTPESLSGFDERSIERFVTIQRKILLNLATRLQKNASLVYVTCSVFKEENEMNVDWIVSNTSLSLEKSGYFKGYEKGADTMFAAKFISR